MLNKHEFLSALFCEWAITPSQEWNKIIRIGSTKQILCQIPPSAKYNKPNPTSLLTVYVSMF